MGHNSGCAASLKQIPSREPGIHIASCRIHSVLKIEAKNRDSKPETFVKTPTQACFGGVRSGQGPNARLRLPEGF
jgi:hypothetical protein